MIPGLNFCRTFKNSDHIFKQFIFAVEQPRLTIVKTIALEPSAKAFDLILLRQSFVWIFVHGEQSDQKRWISRVISFIQPWLFNHLQVPSAGPGSWSTRDLAKMNQRQGLVITVSRPELACVSWLNFPDSPGSATKVSFCSGSWPCLVLAPGTVSDGAIGIPPRFFCDERCPMVSQPWSPMSGVQVRNPRQ